MSELTVGHASPLDGKAIVETDGIYRMAARIAELEAENEELKRRLEVWEALDTAHKQQIDEIKARAIEEFLLLHQNAPVGRLPMYKYHDLYDYAQKLRGEK